MSATANGALQGDAGAVVIAGMTACLPPGSPLAFSRIVRARFDGRGRARRAIADVEMFDGLSATVAVWNYSFADRPAWAHEWLAMEGGDASLEDGAWVRVDWEPALIPPQSAVPHPSPTPRSPTHE